MLMESVRGILCSLCFIFTISTCIDGSCNFPSQFQNSSWWDSTKGPLTFTLSSMSGWKFNAYTSTVNTWECWNMAYFQTDGYFIIKSTDAIYFFGVNYFAYLCLKMVKVTDYSYYYYQQYGQQLTAYNERVYVINNPLVTDLNIICNSPDAAKDGEFHVLLKQGKEVDALRDCPNPIRGNFDYIYYGADGTTACSSSSDYWVVCNDGKTMTFNYSTCTQRMAYSAGGTVWCVASVSGSTTFVVVYNNDTTVDDVNTFKFTCFAVSNDSSRASMISKNCELNQTPDTMPTRYNTATNSLVSAGAILNLTAYVLCPITTTTTTLTTTTTSTTITTTMTTMGTTTTTTMMTTTTTPAITTYGTTSSTDNGPAITTHGTTSSTDNGPAITTYGTTSSTGSGTSGRSSAAGGESGVNEAVIGAAAGGGLFGLAVLAAAIVLVYCLKFKKTEVSPL